MGIFHWLGSAIASVLVGVAALFGLGSGTVSPDAPAVQLNTYLASSSTPASSEPAQHAASTVSAGQHTAVLDVHALPLGDGKVSSAAKVGYVYSCQESFRGGGAEHAGSWIEGNTWDLTKKLSVLGSVFWPSAVFSTYVEGAQRMLKGDGLPVDTPTGIFPIGHSDPAYQIDRNPNSIEAYTVSILVPAAPSFAASPSCVPMGAIGYALNGVAIYNALDDAGRDAVAHEVQDSCDGHPQGQGQYHYHGPSPCMPNYDKNATVVGYALDGFPITSLYDATGREYTNADLDACHGTTSTYVDADGKTHTGYHYALTAEYPYTVGCYRGTPVRTTQAGGGQNASRQAAQGSSQPSPPQAAINACTGKQAGASCSIPNGPSGTCTNMGGSFACKPQ